MATYYTDKQSVLNLVLSKHPELADQEIRLNLCLYFLFCIYIHEASQLKEEVGIIEQNDFYPRYLFKPNWIITLYGPQDKSLDYNLEDTSYVWGTTSFDEDIKDFLIKTLEESLLPQSDFSLVDRWHEENYVVKCLKEAYDGISLNIEWVYDLWSK